MSESSSKRFRVDQNDLKSHRNQFFVFTREFYSGVPLYRQLIDQVLIAIAVEALAPGDRLPTVTEVANALFINSNTVTRAYRELVAKDILVTRQGVGTFIACRKSGGNEVQRQRQIRQKANEFVARISAYGYSLEEVIKQLEELKLFGRYTGL